MNDKKILVGLVFSLLLVGCVVIFSNSIEEEDISSYNIKDRYDCSKIKNVETYNECVMFYLEKDPYKLGDTLVPIKDIN